LFHRSTNVLKTKVATNNGIVTVRGNVNNGAEKDLVGKLVNNVKGVKGFKNKLIIVLTSNNG
jgi:osmotically-inducible protein OsmY